MLATVTVYKRAFSLAELAPPTVSSELAVRQPGLSYLHAGGPGVHAGVEDGDEHASAVILGKPSEVRRGAGFFLGEQPVEGERFFGRMSSHDPKKSDNENKAAKWGRQRHGGRDGEEEERCLKRQCGHTAH